MVGGGWWLGGGGDCDIFVKIFEMTKMFGGKIQQGYKKPNHILNTFLTWLTLVYTEILIWLLPTLLAPRDSYSSASPRFFVFYFSISARLLFLVNLGPHLDHRGNMLSNNFLVSCLKLLQSQVSNEIVNNFIFHPIETLEISNVGNK